MTVHPSGGAVWAIECKEEECTRTCLSSRTCALPAAAACCWLSVGTSRPLVLNVSPRVASRCPSAAAARLTTSCCSKCDLSCSTMPRAAVSCWLLARSWTSCRFTNVGTKRLLAMHHTSVTHRRQISSRCLDSVSARRSSHAADDRASARMGHRSEAAAMRSRPSEHSAASASGLHPQLEARRCTLGCQPGVLASFPSHAANK